MDRRHAAIFVFKASLVLDLSFVASIDMEGSLEVKNFEHQSLAFLRTELKYLEADFSHRRHELLQREMTVTHKPIPFSFPH